MCSGVVPQHPPARLTKPARANSASSAEVISGVSSNPVSDIGFGRPAFGYTLTKVSALCDSSSTYGRISAAPSAQFRPTLSGRAWRTEFQNASTVWPDRMRPEASVTVPEIITGTAVQAARRALVLDRLDREDRGLRVERVEDRFDQQQVDAAVEQRTRLLVVRDAQFVEADVARAGVVDVGRDRRGLRLRPERAGDEARAFGRARSDRRRARASLAAARFIS